MHLRHTAAILRDEINPALTTRAIPCITGVYRYMSIREMLTDDSAAFRFFFFLNVGAVTLSVYSKFGNKSRALRPRYF